MVSEFSTSNEPSDHASEFDVIILGAGISGLVSASTLAGEGNRRILVVDEYSHAGGNHIDVRVDEYTFDVGSYIFQDDSPLLRHFPELLDLYVPIEPTWGRLNPQGLVTRYPISIRDDVIAAGFVELLRMGLSVLTARLLLWRLRNARDFARYWIGGRLLYRSGLANYMKRFYGLSPEFIDIRFAEQRMQWIKEHATPMYPLRRWLQKPKHVPTNRQMARPEEGFATLYAAATKRLEDSGVTFLFDASPTSLVKDDSFFDLSVGPRTFRARRIVSTIPIPRINRLCGLATSAGDLETVTLISLFFSFSGDRGFRDSILYNFSHEGAWKRLTVYSDFYGRRRGREYFTAEVNADHVSESVEVAEEDFRHHSAANGLFKGDLKLEGSHKLGNAYPIYTEQADERAAKAVDDLRKLGIESFGRQGGFDYQPTARDSTLKTEAALRRG